MTVDLVFNPAKTSSVVYNGCQNDGYEVVVGATTYNEANPVGMEILTATDGCDSVVTIALIFRPNAADLVTYDGCQHDGYTVTVGSTVYDENNPTGTEILTAANGCDSTITVNLVFKPDTTGLVTYEGCEEDGYTCLLYTSPSPRD